MHFTMWAGRSDQFGGKIVYQIELEAAKEINILTLCERTHMGKRAPYSDRSIEHRSIK